MLPVAGSGLVPPVARSGTARRRSSSSLASATARARTWSRGARRSSPNGARSQRIRARCSARASTRGSFGARALGRAGGRSCAVASRWTGAVTRRRTLKFQRRTSASRMTRRRRSIRRRRTTRRRTTAAMARARAVGALRARRTGLVAAVGAQKAASNAEAETGLFAERAGGSTGGVAIRCAPAVREGRGRAGVVRPAAARRARTEAHSAGTGSLIRSRLEGTGAPVDWGDQTAAVVARTRPWRASLLRGAAELPKAVFRTLAESGRVEGEGGAARVLAGRTGRSRPVERVLRSKFLATCLAASSVVAEEEATAASVGRGEVGVAAADRRASLIVPAAWPEAADLVAGSSAERVREPVKHQVQLISAWRRLENDAHVAVRRARLLRRGRRRPRRAGTLPRALVSDQVASWISNGRALPRRWDGLRRRQRRARGRTRTRQRARVVPAERRRRRRRRRCRWRLRD